MSHPPMDPFICRVHGIVTPSARFQKDGGLERYCKTCKTEKGRKWRLNNPGVELASRRARSAAINAATVLRRRTLKRDLIAAYGGRCMCCGETAFEFMTIDHINNDGAAHRKQPGYRFGNDFYGWLKRAGYPKDRFRLLCMNCNFARGHYGLCPHVPRTAAEIRSAFVGRTECFSERSLPALRKAIV